MLFYFALAIACVITASVCLWLFRSLVDVGRSAYHSILPSVRNNRLEARREAAFVALNANLTDARSPWGWGNNDSPSRMRRKEEDSSGERVPWGWPGNSGLKRSNLGLIGNGLAHSAAAASIKNLERNDRKARNAIGWPYREERFETRAKRRKSRTAKVAEGGRNSKPWGW